MRNIIPAIVLTILASSLAFSQIDIKDTTGFNVYVSDTLYSTHKNISNALESQLKALKKNPSAKVEVLPYGKVEATLSSTFFEGTEIINVGADIKEIDTTIFAMQMNKVYEKNTNARHFFIAYKKDSTRNAVSAFQIVAKDSLVKPLECVECGTKPIKIRFKAKEIDGFIFDAKEVSHQYIVKDSVIETTTTLELTNLRIEETTRGVKIRVVGNEPNTMYFKFRESGTTEWLETIRETSYNYDSHGIFEPRLFKGKTYDLQAIGTDINGVEVIFSIFDFIYI
jgi:hypothetical protein